MIHQFTLNQARKIIYYFYKGGTIILFKLFYFILFLFIYFFVQYYFILFLFIYFILFYLFIFIYLFFVQYYFILFFIYLFLFFLRCINYFLKYCRFINARIQKWRVAIGMGLKVDGGWVDSIGEQRLLLIRDTRSNMMTRVTQTDDIQLQNQTNRYKSYKISLS